METRFNPPSKYTSAEFKKLVKVIGDTVGDVVEYEIYIQTSRDENDVKWVEAGDFLLEALECRLSDPHFIDELMSLYESKKKIENKEKTNE